MAAKNEPKSLKDAFNTWTKALESGDLETFWDMCHEQSEILDEDYPWRLDKREFQDHINFHLAAGGKGMWEFFQWLPREMHFVTIGDTGHVSGYSTLRGKPRDAGFRQRYMGFTHTWVREKGTWKLLCWHQSPLEARILGASPT